MTQSHVQNFLQLTEQFSQAGNQLASGLYAESALFAAKEVSSSVQAGHITKHLSKPLEHYTALLNTAKNLALETRKRAHAPFSNFLVGAALIDEEEGLHQGCNVECSSYGLTICAERTALVSAVAQGKKRFFGVVVAADTDNLTPPCGACRQLLYDFAPDALVVLVNPRGAEKRFTMKELLPEAFSAAFL
jgi:cytidine deaminase